MGSVALWIVNPHPAVASAWQRSMASQGWTVAVLPDLARLLAELTPNKIGLALVDFDCLPLAGAERVSRLKEAASGVSLLLTSRGELDTGRVIPLLEAGVDDLILHSTPPALLVAKLKAHLRRLLPQAAQALETIERGDLRVNVSRRELSVRTKGKWASRTDMTTIELQLLGLLLGRPGSAIERRQILEAVWGDRCEGVQPGTVDKHVESLRRKLGRIGGRIETVYGVGYRYKEEEAKTR